MKTSESEAFAFTRNLLESCKPNDIGDGAPKDINGDPLVRYTAIYENGLGYREYSQIAQYIRSRAEGE